MNNPSESRMDVFAVLEDQVRYTRSVYLDQLSKYGHISGLAKELAKIESKYRDAERAKAAIAELIAADREFDEARVAFFNCKRGDIHSASDAIDAATARRASALAALEQNP